MKKLIALVLILCSGTSWAFLHKYYAFRCLSKDRGGSIFVNFSKSFQLDNGKNFEFSGRKVALTYFNDSLRTTIVGNPKKQAEKHCEEWALSMGLEERYDVLFCRHPGLSAASGDACDGLWPEGNNFELLMNDGSVNKIEIFSQTKFAPELDGNHVNHAYVPTNELDVESIEPLYYQNGVEQPQVTLHEGLNFCTTALEEMSYYGNNTGVEVKVFHHKNNSLATYHLLGTHPEFADGVIYKNVDEASKLPRFFMSNFPRSPNFGPFVQAFSNNLRRIKRFKLKMDEGDFFTNLEWSPWRNTTCR